MERNRIIDFVKGIGILLVVLGHSGFPGTGFIYLFHMALFFIAAGFCYNENNSVDIQSLWSLAKRKLKTLYLPYVLFNVVLLLCHNIFWKYQIYTSNPLFLEQTIGGNGYGLVAPYSLKDYLYNLILILGFVGGEQLGGVVWFLRILFELTLLYACMDFVSRKFGKYRMAINWTASIVVLLLGYYFSVNSIVIVAGLHVTCSCMIFFTIGVTLKKYNIMEKLPKWRTLLLSLIGLLLCSQKGSVSINTNEYLSILFLVLNGIMGWGLVWSVSLLIQNVKTLSFFEYMGKKTMYILLGHFLCFKIVTILYVSFNHLPRYLFASFPVLNISGLWIGYTLIGVLVPFGVSICMDKIRSAGEQYK